MLCKLRTPVVPLAKSVLGSTSISSIPKSPTSRSEKFPSMTAADQPAQSQPQEPLPWHCSLLGCPVAQASEQKLWPFRTTKVAPFASHVQLWHAHFTKAGDMRHEQLIALQDFKAYTLKQSAMLQDFSPTYHAYLGLSLIHI